MCSIRIKGPGWEQWQTVASGDSHGAGYYGSESLRMLWNIYSAGCILVELDAILNLIQMKKGLLKIHGFNNFFFKDMIYVAFKWRIIVFARNRIFLLKLQFQMMLKLPVSVLSRATNKSVVNVNESFWIFLSFSYLNNINALCTHGQQL